MAKDSVRYEVFTIEESKIKDVKGFWHKIGTGWKNSDGSFNITLAAVPVNGTLHMRLPKPKEESFDE